MSVCRYLHLDAFVYLPVFALPLTRIPVFLLNHFALMQ